MEITPLLTGLLYANPVMTCLTLFSINLYSHQGGKARDFSALDKLHTVRRLLYCIWVAQICLVILWFLSTIYYVDPWLEALRLSGAYRLYEAYLTSGIAIMLFLIAGLLPDPNEPFTPKVANGCSWTICLAFDLSAFSVATTFKMYPGTGSTYHALIVTRNAVLLSQIVLLSVASYLQRKNDHGYMQLKNQPLLVGESGQGTAYGTASRSIVSQRAGDAQNTGWIDYFVGFRALFPYLWPSDSRLHQLRLVVCLFLLIAQRIINILVPYQLGILVDSLGYGRIPYKSALLYIFYQGLQGQQGVIGATRAIIWIPLSQDLFRRLTCAAFEHVLSLSLDFHLSNRLGELMSALTKGSALNTFLDAFAFQLFPMVLDLGVAAIYFSVHSRAFYSLILLGVMWSYIFITIYMATYRGRARRTMAARERDMSATKADTLMAYETVHHNSAIEMVTVRFREVVSSFQEAEYSVLFSLNGLNVVQNLIFTVGMALIALLCCFQISIGQHSVAFFVSLLAYFNQLRAPLAFFGSFYNQVQNNLVDAERMLDLFKHKPSIVDSSEAQEMTSCTGCIKFENVSFSYDTRTSGLRNVSFTVVPGTSTAIVGESGSGKSTLLKLLMRFYETQKGEISVDGQDVRRIKLKSLRRYIGVVPQDTILFNTTLMNNLLFAKPNATNEEVYDACRAASIHGKILLFPDGYETIVGERGLKLSGGEKQRIAIARAILKRPQIIILDEATSSLDSTTEKQIQGALENVIQGRTNISIAHRLSTIVTADQILVLHDGEIIERGSHKNLIKLKGHYAKMWDKQMQQQQEVPTALPLDSCCLETRTV